MLILNSTDSLRVNLLNTTVTLPFNMWANFRTINTSTNAYTPGRSVIQTSVITDVNLVSPPSAGETRIIDTFIIRNNDTANNRATIKINDGTTSYIILSIILAPGEAIQYQDGQGFSVLNTLGSIKYTVNQGSAALSSGYNTTVLPSDVTNNNAVANTMQDITGLSFPVVANTLYFFRFYIWYIVGTTTTGSRWSLNGPSQDILVFTNSYSLTTTSNTVSTSAAYDIPAASNASSALVSPSGNISIITGWIRPTVDGTVIGRFASEVANSAVIAKAGSFVEYFSVI